MVRSTIFGIVEIVFNLFITGVVLSSSLVRDYLYNYARSLIYTTAPTFTEIIAINCGLDFLEDGTADKVKLSFFYILKIIKFPW